MTQEAATCPQLQHVFLGVGPDPLRALEDARRPVRFLLNAFLKAAHPRAPGPLPPWMWCPVLRASKLRVTGHVPGLALRWGSVLPVDSGRGLWLRSGMRPRAGFLL